MNRNHTYQTDKVARIDNREYGNRLNSKCKYFKTILLCGYLLYACCTVETDTKISISNNSNPPSFKLSGTGVGPMIMMGGPYEYVDRNTTSTRLWEISAIFSENNLPIWRIPPITYGVIPYGFVQKYPENGKPPSLQEGKNYCIFVHVFSANPGNICFTIKNNKAIEVNRE